MCSLNQEKKKSNQNVKSQSHLCECQSLWKLSIPQNRWTRLNLNTNPSTCLQSLDANKKKNGPKLNVVSCSINFPSDNFLALAQLRPRSPVQTAARNPLANRVCEKESTFNRWQNATNQPINQQRTNNSNGKFHLASIKEKKNKERKKRSGWNWFQGKFSASNFPGQLFRWRTPTRNKILPRSQESVGVGRRRAAVETSAGACGEGSGVGRLWPDRGKFVRCSIDISV